MSSSVRLAKNYSKLEEKKSRYEEKRHGRTHWYTVNTGRIAVMNEGNDMSQIFSPLRNMLKGIARTEIRVRRNVVSGLVSEVKPVSCRRQVRAFTLIELLVVVSVIAILIAMLMPALSRVKRAAKVVLCMNNLKQVGQGLFMYAGENDSFFPDSRYYGTGGPRSRPNHVHYKSGANGFNLVDVLKPAYNDTLNDVFRCPLSVPGFQPGGAYGDLDNKNSGGNHSLNVPYNLYFGEFTVTSTSGSSSVFPCSRPATEPFMRKIGQDWKLFGGSNDGKGKQYSILASDIMVASAKVYNGCERRTYSTHSSPSGHSGATGNDINTGFFWINREAWNKTDACYLDGDGSVHLYKGINYLEGWNGSSLYYHTNSRKIGGQILPKDLAK